MSCGRDDWFLFNFQTILKNDALTLSFWLRPDTLTFAKYYLHFWFGWIRSELLDCLKLLMEMTLQLWTRNKKITSFFDFLINSIWAMLSIFRFKLSPKSIISHKNANHIKHVQKNIKSKFWRFFRGKRCSLILSVLWKDMLVTKCWKFYNIFFRNVQIILFSRVNA